MYTDNPGGRLRHLLEGAGLSDYEIAPDGLRREIVGEWATEKHERLRRYIDISRYARKKFLEGPAHEATYIDLFCGPGQSRIKGTQTVIDGSPLAAFHSARNGGQPFTSLHLGDADGENVEAACARIAAAGGVATPYVGKAEDVAHRVVAAVNSDALHFALLDPYSLESLSFPIIQTLAQLPRIDMLLHVSQMDLQRNLDAYGAEDEAALDSLVPGWRSKVDHKRQSQQAARAGILNYWCRLVEGLGFATPKYELITGGGNQKLYWLAFISRKPIANDFWDKIRNISVQGRLDL